MGDVGDFWNDVRAARREERDRLGIECPECRRLLPKASATILLPGQTRHKRGHFYRDPRQKAAA